MVVGHYGCSGIRAAMEGQRLGLVDNWIRHVQEVRDKHAMDLAWETPEHRLDRLCELNVAEQFTSICQTTILQDAWKRGQPVAVQGLVYSLRDGLLREIGLSADCAALAEQVYSAMINQRRALRGPASGGVLSIARGG
jgi:carbonic anhydrase